MEKKMNIIPILSISFFIIVKLFIIKGKCTVKAFFLDKSIDIIRKNENYSEEKLDEIRYGLEGIYVTITKAIIILFLSSIFHIAKEFIMFAVLYKIIRL
jgi:hypothetical protein